MSAFSLLTEAWNDPSARHAMLVHFPVALALLGALLLIALATTGFKSRGLKTMIAVVFLLASISALLARNAGEDAEHALEERAGALTIAEHDALEAHEEAGEWIWAAALTPAVLVGISLARDRRVRIVFGLLALATGLLAAERTITTAGTGGQLIWAHGLAAPERTPGELYNPTPPPPAGEQGASGAGTE